MPRRARELAEEEGVTVTQIAVAFVMNQPMNVFALVGCRNADEFRANAEARELKLAPEEMDWLDLRKEAR